MSTAQWSRAFSVALATFLVEYSNLKQDGDDKPINVPIDNIVALAAGVALKIVEISDGDDA
tara:strand:+ start:16143 stop:16325 length:183 start_codon:yes stop_codon:yes gene_type:complete